MLTVIVLAIAVISAAMVNAEVQRRLLAQGGSWFPSTIKSGLCGFGAMICIVAAYFTIGTIAAHVTG